MPERAAGSEAPGGAGDAGPLAALEARGLVYPEGDRYRPTRRFRGAMMRAALRLMAGGDPGDDLRVPIAAALVEVLGETASDADIARYVVAMLPVQSAELSGSPPR